MHMMLYSVWCNCTLREQLDELVSFFIEFFWGQNKPKRENFCRKHIQLMFCRDKLFDYVARGFKE